MFDAGDTKDEILNAIGKRISDLRLSRGMTQEELAHRAGLSKRAVERLENGQGNPRLEVLVAICMELSLVAGFKTLLPEVRLSPSEILKGKKLPRRVRKTRQRQIKWGDEP